MPGEPMTTTEPASFDRGIGRRAFGLDPKGYDAGRPDYPSRVFDILIERCGLGRDTCAFEVGPGTGKATHELLARGAHPVIAIEPNAELAAYLRARFGGAIEVQQSPFESAQLADAEFDLGIAATSFHWVEPAVGWPKIMRALKPGGWWAMWWNHYGDPDSPDAFYQALRPLYAELPRRVYGERPLPPLDEMMRMRSNDLRNAGLTDVGSEVIRWPLTLSTERMQALYASFSELAIVDEDARKKFLAGLGRIVDEQFGGRVERTWVTSIHFGQRPR